jgi:hypothetical protein
MPRLSEDTHANAEVNRAQIQHPMPITVPLEKNSLAKPAKGDVNACTKALARVMYPS